MKVCNGIPDLVAPLGEERRIRQLAGHGPTRWEEPHFEPEHEEREPQHDQGHPEQYRWQIVEWPSKHEQLKGGDDQDDRRQIAQAAHQSPAEADSGSEEIPGRTGRPAVRHQVVTTARRRCMKARDPPSRRWRSGLLD